MNAELRVDFAALIETANRVKVVTIDGAEDIMKDLGARQLRP